VTALDAARVRAFGGQMLGVLNHSLLGLMIRIGQRTGLFEAMAGAGARSSAEIAGSAGLDEEFVRGWLGAMAAGRVVDYDGARGVYRLPAEHAAALGAAGAAGGDLHAMTRTLALLGALEDEVVAGLCGGGGVPEAALARAVALGAEESAARLTASLIPAILPLAPGLTARLAAGIDVLDLGVAGRAAELMAAAYPASRIARAAPGDLAGRDQPAAAAFDLVTALDGIGDRTQPAALLAAARRALRPGGLLFAAGVAASSHLADNLDHPLAPALYAAATLRAAGLWGEERAREAILAAGFADLEVRRLDLDLVHNYYIGRVPR